MVIIDRDMFDILNTIMVYLHMDLFFYNFVDKKEIV